MKDTLNQINLEKDKKFGNKTMKNITTTLDKIVDCLDDNSKKEMNNSIDKLSELFLFLKEEIQKRSDEIGYDYDFEDYESRLCVSNEKFNAVFENKILSEDLGKYFGEYIKLLNNEEFIKKRIIKELFEDLVYENLENEKDYTMGDIERLAKKNNIDSYIKEIKEKTSKNLVKSLNLWGHHLGKNLGKDGMIKLVQEAGKNGIKSLNFWDDQLGENLLEDGMIKLVQEAGKSGIKRLNLGGNYLGLHLKEDGMIKLIQKAGNTGIKSLNLGLNQLGYELETKLKEEGKKIGIKIIT